MKKSNDKKITNCKPRTLPCIDTLLCLLPDKKFPTTIIHIWPRRHHLNLRLKSITMVPKNRTSASYICEVYKLCVVLLSAYWVLYSASGKIYTFISCMIRREQNSKLAFLYFENVLREKSRGLRVALLRRNIGGDALGVFLVLRTIPLFAFNLPQPQLLPSSSI